MLFLLILILALFIIGNASKRYEKETSDPNVQHTFVKKTCPPHKWRWVEIKDQDGNKVTERLVCDICGPLRVQ